MARVKLKGNKPKPVFSINVETGFDIPTGTWVIGKYGETILNGGANTLTAITGPGNSFKSIIIQHLLAKLLEVVNHATEPYCMYYDSENNVSIPRINSLFEKYKGLPSPIIDETGVEDDDIINLTDKATIAGDKWWKEVVDLTKEIKKNQQMMKFEMFTEKNKVYKHYPPTAVVIDSWSKFSPEIVDDMLDKAKGEEVVPIWYL